MKWRLKYSSKDANTTVAASSLVVTAKVNTLNADVFVEDLTS